MSRYLSASVPAWYMSNIATNILELARIALFISLKKKEISAFKCLNKNSWEDRAKAKVIASPT
jgi:hypothetical protein